MNIQVLLNATELAQAAATQFAQLAAAAVSERGLFTVALSGGSTPRQMFKLLADPDEPFRAQVPWEQSHFFWTDERHVPPDHPDSNYRMVNEAMLLRVPVPPANVHRIAAENLDAAQAAVEYEQTLRAFFQVKEDELPRFDLITLGLGQEGHTASIFPGSEVLDEKRRLVAAPWVDKFKSYRITLTLPVLNNAAFVVFLVSGDEKAEILRDVLQGMATPTLVPAKAIRPTNGRLLWLVDAPAVLLLNTN